MIAPIESTGPKNVLGEPLVPCCNELSTGWYRNGICETDQNDGGRHVICARMTDEFLSFSQAVPLGSEATTDRPHSKRVHAQMMYSRSVLSART